MVVRACRKVRSSSTTNTRFFARCATLIAKHRTLCVRHRQRRRIVRGMPASKPRSKSKPPFVGTSEEFIKLFDLALDMLCIGSFDGYFKLVNPAWEKVLGYSAEELTSRPWLDFIHPDDLEATIREGENR